MSELNDSFRRLSDIHASASDLAVRLKAERDEAICLLRESLMYSATGEQGAFKTRVREFLARLK